MFLRTATIWNQRYPLQSLYRRLNELGTSAVFISYRKTEFRFVISISIHSFQERLSEFYALKTMMNSFMALGHRPWMAFCQWKPNIFRHIPPFKQSFEEYRSIVTHILDFFGRQVKQHRAEIDFSNPDSAPSDYVEAFLKEQAKAEASGDSRHTFT